MELEKNQVFDAEITGDTSDGGGVARIEGRAVFVKGAIIGEKCRVRILKASKSAVYGKIEELTEPSAHRQEPECPHYRLCGGCTHMHMDYEAELSSKRRRVEDALRRIGGWDISVEKITGSPEISGYRNKAIFAVGEADGKAVAGFYRMHTHDIVAAPDCLIQSDDARLAAEAVTEWMNDFKVRAYDERNGKGTVRHIFCRTAEKTGEVQVVVTTCKKLIHTDELVEKIRSKCPDVKSIVMNINKVTGNTVLAGSFTTLWGSDTVNEELCGLKFTLSPMSFFQVNPRQTEHLYACAKDYAELAGAETVLDMYCGTGTISLYMADSAKRVIGAEIVPEAVEDARENAKRNGIENAEFICADASEASKRLLEKGERPDVIVVDPPRKGLNEDVPPILAAMEPKRIVYVSCDPATLARDTARFRELGYGLVKAEAYDMFPRCGHVETVVKLELMR